MAHPISKEAGKIGEILYKIEQHDVGEENLKLTTKNHTEFYASKKSINSLPNENKNSD